MSVSTENPASKVVHVRDIPAGMTEEDLLTVARQFGVVAKHVFMRAKRQALVEMQDLQSAAGLVEFYSRAPLTYQDATLQVQFSTHQQLNRQNGTSSSQMGQPNKILLVTVHDCVYPMTVDVAHQVFSPHGYLEKVVIFSKPHTGVQILVQYTDSATAARAMEALQNQFIYVGVCRLEIQFSTIDDLTVGQNSDTRHDYTAAPGLSSSELSALLPTPNGTSAPSNGPDSRLSQPQQQNPMTGRVPQVGVVQSPMGHMVGGFSGATGFPPAAMTPTAMGCVLLLSNLEPESTTCLTLFNLVSMYGNVVRIKRFYNKPDHALVQMAEPSHAAAVIHHLKGVIVFGRQLNASVSKHVSINAGPNPSNEATVEEAESQSNVGFANSRLNRYRGPNAAKSLKNLYPSNTVHLSNLAESTDEERLREAFSEWDIVAVRMFEAKDHTMALMQFNDVETATNVICTMHNKPVNGKSIRVAYARSSASQSP